MAFPFPVYAAQVCVAQNLNLIFKLNFHTSVVAYAYKLIQAFVLMARGSFDLISIGWSTFEKFNSFYEYEISFAMKPCFTMPFICGCF